MFNEHNPIAQLVNKIQEKWLTEVSPHDHIQLVRWLILPEQSKLYEGFLRLESTADGVLDDMTIVLLTSFKNLKEHSYNLCKDWLTQFKAELPNLTAALKAQDLEFNWDHEKFEHQLNNVTTDDKDFLLLEMLQSFQQALFDKEQVLTLCLLPYSIDDVKEYGNWLKKMTQFGLPEKVKIMFFDYQQDRQFDLLMKEFPKNSKSLMIPLDLDGAINKIATSGNTNDPDIAFRQCLVEMSKSMNQDNLPRLQVWGEKGIKITQQTGSKAALASACTIYGGMLFHFKEYTQTEQLLKRGHRIAKLGLEEAGDDNCKPIIIQNIGFQAANLHLQKKLVEACNLYCQQASLATEYKHDLQALSAWMLAYNCVIKKDKIRYKKIIKEAYLHSNSIEEELLKTSCLNYIALDYYTLCKKEKLIDECESIDKRMYQITENPNWRTDAEDHKKTVNKKKLSIFNWF